MPFPYTFPFTFEDYKLIAQCDWNNDGNWAEDGDYLSDRGYSRTPISVHRGRDQIRQLAPPMVGSASFDLNNLSQDYSVENANSPLSGKLLPGRPVRIRRTQGANVVDLFNGYLDDIPQHAERETRTVSMPCLGALSCLKGQATGQNISTALYQSITTDVALGYILDAVGFPSSKRILDTGQTTIDWWWLDNEDAFSAAVTLLNCEGPGAALYEDASGNVVFESRKYRMVTARCVSSQATFRDSGTEPVFSPPFSYDPRLKDVINVCTVTQKTRAIAASLTAVWSLGSTVTLAPNQVGTYVAKGSDIFTQAVAPVGGTDYTVTSGSVSSATLDRTSGASCTITITAGANGATLTGLQLRAKLVSITNTTNVTNTVDTTSSQSIYGKRVYPLATRAEIAVGALQDFCNAVVGMYQNPRPIAEVTLYGTDATQWNQVLNRQISDRVTVVEAQTGVNADFFIEQVSHELTYGGKLHAAKFGMEKAAAGTYLVWGTGVWGTGLWGY